MKYSSLMILGLLFSGCATKPYVVNFTGEITDTAKNQVHVVSHGWHTGFVIPATPMQIVIPELKQRFADVPYIEFGWGDRGFYQAQEITSGLTMRTIFWPTESVMHAVAVPTNAEDYFPNSEIENFCLGDRELSSLISFITSSFYRNSSGEIQPTKKGIYGDSQFYQGVGNFYLMNTCNSWTAKGLKSAGMNSSPAFKLTAGSVMNYLAVRRKELLIDSAAAPSRETGCP